MRAKRAIWRQFGCKYLLFYRILIADTVANTQNKMKLKKKKKFAQNLWCVKMSKQLQESGAWRYDVFVWKFYHFFSFICDIFFNFIFFFARHLFCLFRHWLFTCTDKKKKSNQNYSKATCKRLWSMEENIIWQRNVPNDIYRKSFNFFFFFFYST